MNIMTNVKTKLSSVSGKILGSKAYKTVERIAVGAGTGLTALGVTAINSSAADDVDFSAVITAAANVGNIMKNAQPFIEPAIIIMCGVAGLRLGMKFLRGAAK